VKVNLGCGMHHMDGWVNVDHNPDCNPDRIADLSKYPFPFPTNSMDEIYCSHLVEHIPDITKFMLELYRIAKNGCIIHIKYPLFTSRSAYADPTHVHQLSHMSLQYYEDTHLQQPEKIFPRKLRLKKIDKEVKCFFLKIRNDRILNMMENFRIPMQETYIKFQAIK
jgi:predicted SAM-dependent methyltransferase